MTAYGIVAVGEPPCSGGRVRPVAGECAVRKRPILLAAAAAVVGLAALGTVVAQQPTGGAPFPPPPGSGYTPTKVVPAGGTPAPVTRPFNEWTPTTPNSGVKQAGGSYVPPPAGAGLGGGQPTTAPGNKQRLTQPTAAGSSPIKPVGGFDLPPPSMDLSNVGAKPQPPVVPAAPTTPPAFPSTPSAPGTLPPPKVSVDPVPDNKFPPSPAFPAPAVPSAPAAPVVPPPAPLVPVPPSTVPTLPAPAVVPPTTTPKPPAPFVPPAAPGTTPVVPPAAGPATLVPPPAATPTAAHQNLPTSVKQGVTVETVCPDTVVYNAEFRYEIVIKNTGNVAVHNVRVEDEIPAAARYVGSDPPGELNGDRLVWAIGAIDGNAEKRIAVRMRPSEEGELRSRATVMYSAAVEAKTRVTRPRVSISAVSQEVVRAGDDAVFKVKVTNTGTGPAQNMVLRAEMTDGLYFSQGPKLETKLANLPAGETKELTLPLNAVKSGLHACSFTVTAEGSPDSTAKASVNVVEPLLQISQSGPAKCLVRAEPTYEITLANPGTAGTDPVTVHAVLPDGFEFVQASDGGAFTAANRAVSWKLPALPAGGTKAVAVKLRAAAAGDVVLRTVAVTAADAAVTPAGVNAKPAGRALEAKAETAIKSEGVAAVRFDVKGLENPVEVGKDAVYEIRVTNQGTGACTNVQVMAAMAENTTFSGANGPTTVKAQGQTLVFDPIANLPVKGEMVYTVRVRGTTAGDHRFRVQLTCDQVRTPVVKEESTSFYKQ